jgi:hypothetical protein
MVLAEAFVAIASELNIFPSFLFLFMSLDVNFKSTHEYIFCMQISHQSCFPENLTYRVDAKKGSRKQILKEVTGAG